MIKSKKKTWVNINKTKKLNNRFNLYFIIPQSLQPEDKHFFVNNKIKFKIDTIDMKSL